MEIRGWRETLVKELELRGYYDIQITVPVDELTFHIKAKLLGSDCFYRLSACTIVDELPDQVLAAVNDGLKDSRRGNRFL